MAAALPALLAEAIFYLGAVFYETRLRLAMLPSRRTQAFLLWLSALIPYLIFASLTRTINRPAFLLIAVLSALLAYWFVLFPRRTAYDFGFLVLAAAPVVLRVFKRLYISPDPHLRIDVLGHLAWIHTGIAALLVLREWDPGAFGLWPRAEEWRIGFLWFAVSIVPIAAVALALHDVRFQPMHAEWWRTVATAIGAFFGFLWVVALSEELFFRGVIERALLDSTRSKIAAVLISALLFGSVHLSFRQFPNWQAAVIAALLGVVCGLAYAQSGSVRAPMVTHALVVATGRLLFQ
ncbi:MAG TPA: CPBP family intramembrane glutamic endopeptidase [Bryobacteraceae bacterium]|jgi:membrane protease YdiL (CAAX protease family)|nr:CPBP family intramembrane glutamic endopeptidase [Bryobacteraceae bacterium]